MQLLDSLSQLHVSDSLELLFFRLNLFLVLLLGHLKCQALPHKLFTESLYIGLIVIKTKVSLRNNQKINKMQQFLLNERVIREVHMKTVELEERTKYAKKYDMPFTKPVKALTQRNLIQSLLQKQRKVLTKPKIDQIVAQNSPKTKHLLSTLRMGGFFLTSDQSPSENKTLIKQSCFKVKGIKKSVKEIPLETKGMNRTCSLVSGNRFSQCQVGPYDVNAEIRFKRSPRCLISPTIKPLAKKDSRKFHMIEDKQNMNPDQKNRQYGCTSDKKQYIQKMSIKQMVDKQIQQQINKRRAICRTAPTKHKDNLNLRQQLSVQYTFGEDDMCKVQAKIYSEMRENREKVQRRNKERIGINITKNKPLTSTEINKNTMKLLKKYNCDNMVYFSKFVTKE